MRILALICARGGSKRLPGKNIRPLGGNPLIVWSIDIVKDISSVCDILVSTDDREIGQVAGDAGAYVPWLRPAELATDTALSVDVCLHALDWYEHEKGAIDGLLLLQPTSPFRSRQTIARGIDLYFANQRRTTIGVSPAESHPLWCFKMENNKMRPFVDGFKIETRSQDLPSAFVVNGSFYLVEPQQFRIRRSFLSDDMVPLLIERQEECLDIDTEWDWKIAEAILSIQKRRC